MKKRLQGFYFIFSTVAIAFLVFPILTTAPVADSKTASATHASPSASAKAPADKPSPSPSPLPSVYDSLDLDHSGLSREAYDYAIKGFQKMASKGQLKNNSIVSIVDFSQPSSKKRLYVIDLKNYRVLFNTLVAHGKNTGLAYAKNFSNQLSSFKSSPGFYITRDTYQGGNGYSLKLDGIEKGINDMAMERAIVMHGADYVSNDFINAKGYIGRSHGCPAVPAKQAKSIINTIKDGTCLFIYQPSPSYIQRSVILRG